MDEDACYHYLLDLFHPQGPHCPRCQAHEGCTAHRYYRGPVLDYRCRACGRAFNAGTGTAPQGTRYRPSQIVPIVRGFAQGVATAQLARELGCSRKDPLGLRPMLQSQAKSGRDRTPLKGAVVGADERDQDAGGKGAPHLDPDDPPRRRANKRRGHGTMEDDRPPAIGVVGRDSGAVRLEVVEHAGQETLDHFVEETTPPGATVNTAEWGGYDHLPEFGRGHATVCPAPGQRGWARDDDGDGVREVHNNTMEGTGPGVRTFLRDSAGWTRSTLAIISGFLNGHSM